MLIVMPSLKDLFSVSCLFSNTYKNKKISREEKEQTLAFGSKCLLTCSDNHLFKRERYIVLHKLNF